MKMDQSIVEAVISELDTHYLTITDLSRAWGYTDMSYLSRKASKLGLGLKVKKMFLISKEEAEILKININRRLKDEEDL